MAVTLKEILVKLGADTKEVDSALHNTSKKAKEFGDVFSGLGKKIAAVISTAAVVKFMKDSAGAAIESEMALKQLNQTLISTKGVSGMTSEGLQNLAKSLQNVTTYEDDAIIQAETLLLTFTKIGKDVFPETTEAVLNLATKMNMDLRSAAVMVGKAMNDPVSGVTALRKAGVQLTDEQESQIKQFIKLGDVTSAQKIVLGELATQMGGSARAAAETFGGSLMQLQNIFANFKEEIGNAIIQNEGFKQAFAKIKELLQDPKFVEALASIAENLVEIFTSTIPIMVEVTRVLAEIIRFVVDLKDVIIPLGAAIAATFAVSKIAPFFGALTTYFKVLKLEGVSNVNALGGAVDGVSGKTGVLSGNINGVKGALANVGPMAIAAFGGWAIGTLINDLLNLQEKIAQISKFEMDQAFKFSGIKAGFIEISGQSKAFTDKMEAEINKISEKYGIQRDEIGRNSKAFGELSDMAQKYYRSIDLGKSQENIKLIKELGGELTGHSQSLRENAAAILNNKEAFGKLNIEQQELVKNIVSHVGKVKESDKANKDLSITVAETNKKLKEQAEAFEKLASSMGILTVKGYQEQSKEIVDLIGLYEDSKVQILGNEEVAKKWIDKINELADRALPAEKEALIAVAREIRLTTEAMLPAIDKTREFNIALTTFDYTTGKFTQDSAGSTAIIKEWTDKAKQAAIQTVETKDKTADLSATFTALSTTVSNAFNALSALGINLGKLGGLLQGASQGINAIGAGINATKIKGTDLTSVIGKLGGYFTIATGALSILKSVLKLFAGPSGELEAARRNIEGITGTTKDWTKEIEKLAKEIGGAGSAEKAFAKLLPQIIADSETTSANFKKLVESTRNIISTWQWAGGSIEEVQDNFGAAFDALLAKSRELGVEGGADMTGLILLADEYGLKVKEIADYIDANMENATRGWADVMTEFGGVSIPVLDEQVRLMKMIESIPSGIANEIKGATDALIGLSNANRLNQDEFNQFGLVVKDVQDKLAAQGITGEDAAYAMKDMLERLIYLSNEYGLQIDEGTAALIREGVEHGKLSTDIKSNEEKQIELQEKQYDLWMLIAEAMGVNTKALGDFTGAAERMGDTVNRNLSNMQDNLYGIADTINNEVVGAMRNMGDTNDDIMWKGSILPDFQEWETINEKIKKQLKEDMVMAAIKMGDVFTTRMIGMNGTAETFNDQMIEDVEALRDLYEQLGLEMVAAGMGTSKYERYGIGVEERDTAQFAELQALWQQNWEAIAKSDKGLTNFLGDLEDLDVLDSMEGDLADFIAWVTYAGEQMKAGLVWDPSSFSFIKPNVAPTGEQNPNITGLQGGTGGYGFTIPPGFPNDSYRVGLTSGEKIYVEPQGSRGLYVPGISGLNFPGNTRSAGSTVNNITQGSKIITNNWYLEGIVNPDLYVLARNLNTIIENDIEGTRTKMEKL